MNRAQPMSPHSEEIQDRAVNRGEALQLSNRLEAPHLAFALLHEWFSCVGGGPIFPGHSTGVTLRR
jgi:hypothetical protein